MYEKRRASASSISVILNPLRAKSAVIDNQASNQLLYTTAAAKNGRPQAGQARLGAHGRMPRRCGGGLTHEVGPPDGGKGRRGGGPARVAAPGRSPRGWPANAAHSRPKTGLPRDKASAIPDAPALTPFVQPRMRKPPQASCLRRLRVRLVSREPIRPELLQSRQ